MGDEQGSGRPRFKASTVVARAQPVTAPARRVAEVAGSSGAVPGLVGFRTPTQPGFTTVGMFGAGLLLLSLMGMILNFTLPWIKVGDDTLDRGEVDDRSFGDYTDRFVSWPVLAFVFCMILAVGLVVLDFVPNWIGAQRLLQVVALGATAYFGFLVLLTGFRWLGNYFEALWSGNPGEFQLHVVPYLNLVLGAAMVLGSLWALRGPAAYFLRAPDRGRLGPGAIKISAFLVLAAAAALCVNPLVPFASVDPPAGDTAYWGEISLIAQSEISFGSGDNVEPGDDLGYFLGMMWFVLYLALFALLLSLIERMGFLVQLWGTFSVIAFLAIAIPLVIATIYTIMLYFDIPQMTGTFGQGDVSLLWFNWIPAVALGVLGFLYAQGILRFVVPFFKAMRASMPTMTAG